MFIIYTLSMAIKNDVSSPLDTKKSGYSPKQERVEYLPKIQNIELKIDF